MASDVPDLVTLPDVTYGDYICRKGTAADLLADDNCHNHKVDNEQNNDTDTESQAHMVQRPGHPAGPLCSHPVPSMVGFTS